jgi:hypothetical protein
MNWDRIRKFIAGSPHQYAFGSVERAFGSDKDRIRTFRKEAEAEGFEVEIEKGVVYVLPQGHSGVKS